MKLRSLPSSFPVRPPSSPLAQNNLYLLGENLQTGQKKTGTVYATVLWLQHLDKAKMNLKEYVQ